MRVTHETEHRLHICFSCSRAEFRPVVLSDSTPNLSGEAREYCPECSKSFALALPVSKLNAGPAKKTFGPRACPSAGYGSKALIKACVRYDDSCGNGHNSFAITGEIYVPGRPDCEACGCLHDEIAKYFPELRSFIKWHGCTAAGPLYYIENTLYQAGERDCWGLLAGEFKPHLGKDGLPQWNIPFQPAYDRTHEYISAAEKPAPLVLEYEQFGTIGKGKARELDAARANAIWPDATDAELCSPDLRSKLIERLPALMAEFKSAVESLGLTY